ncbi:hypothetical protein C9374_011659 [Naegleria lovaniensis]|uniref:Adenylate and Guanylate cyclase catalytic domain containing protein n=1 Tax=Naegleria lovaniensis TaxID=51637 RepID=A0AA88GG56_NAELO|nr:uncharacterized protein C9374_011659 [Naegleria lovaniensis]KAG2373994.1 hypothetical protein C9374_011659 [Naegleria lovaniensis]
MSTNRYLSNTTETHPEAPTDNVVLADEMPNPQHVVFPNALPKQPSVYSLSSTSSHSTINSLGQKALAKIQDVISSTLLVLIDAKSKHGWKSYLMVVILYIYIWIGSIVIGLEGEYNFGLYGSWIWRAFNYLVTFSFNAIPYEAAIALSSLCILISISVLCLFLYTSRVYHKADRSIKTIQSLVKILGFVIYFGHLVMTYLMTSFIDCNYSSSVTFDGFSEPQKVLNRFPSYMCFSSSNIALIVLNFLGIICLMLSSMVCCFVLGNCHIRNERPFISDNSLFIGSVLVISEIQITLNAIIPNSFMFVKSILHILLSFTLFVMLLYLLPYYRRYENSLIGALCLGKTFICVFPLISFLVNSKNEWEMGLAFATSALGMFLIGFLIGFFIVEIYTRVLYKMTRLTIMQAVVECAVLIIDDGFTAEERFQTIKNLFEKEAIALFKDMEERKQIRNLELFLKFCLLSGNEGNDDTFGFSDKDMAICMIKSVSQHKRFQHKNLLVSSSLLCAYFWDMDRQVTFTKSPKSYCISSLEYSQTLLKRVKNEKMGILLNFMLKEKLKQIQDSLRREKGDSKDFSTVLDMSEMLNRLEKDTLTIVQCRKLVWKELMNDTVNENRVLEINRVASSLIMECEETFENLMKLFSEEKSVLRLYARFNEEVLFNSDKASELYQDAQSIEDEDARKGHQVTSNTTVSTSFRRSASKNRVLPSSCYKKTSTTQQNRNSVNIRNSFSKGNVFANAMITSNLNGLHGTSKEMVEDSSNLDISEAADAPEVKKEMIYKSSIATSENHLLWYSAMISTNVIIGVLFLVKVILACIAVSASTSHLDTIQYACTPSARSLTIISNVRVHQIVSSLFGNKFPTSLTSAGFLNMSDYDKTFSQRVSTALEDFYKLQNLALSGLLSDQIYRKYSTDSSLVYYPEIPHNNLYGQYLNPKPRNVSMSTLTHSFLQYSEVMKTWKGRDFNQSLLTDFVFMYLWHNRDSFSHNYGAFCDSVANEVFESVTRFRQEFIYYCIASFIVSFLLCLLMASIQLIFTLKIRKVVKLFKKHLPKEAIGKIFHDIKVNEGETKATSRLWQNPNLRSITYIVLFGTLFFLCSSLILYIALAATDSSSSIIQNIQYSVRVATSAQITTLHIGEIYIFGILPYDQYNMNSALLFDHDGVYEYHEGIDESTKDLERYWDQLIYGHGKFPPLVGKYPEIDAILKGLQCQQLGNSSSNSTKCESLHNIVHDFLLKAIEINEIYASKGKDVVKVFDQYFTHLYESCHKLSNAMINFIEIYVVSVQKGDSQTWTIVIGILGIILLPIVTYWSILSVSNHFSEIQCLRMMLNYVKVENIDTKEPLRNYILFHHLEWIKHKKSSRREDDDKVRNVLNATVDGAVLCNQEFVVDIYNPSAQRMFGKNMNEVVGLPLWNLFGQENKERIQTSLNHMKNNTGSIVSGETLEIECSRKNGTKFPAKLNISWTTFDGKPVFVCFIKDITTEKKQNSLLAEEKKTSENLLRNILPESVAKKLKNGETFIAEKLPDITCFFSDMVGFTKLSSSMNAHQVVKMLSDIVNGFDSLTDKYELEKIKTIGDAYFCVGGLHQASDHAERVLRFAMETFRVVRNYNHKMILEMIGTSVGNDSNTHGLISSSSSNNNLMSPTTTSATDHVIHQVDIRVGLNTGAVVAGVIGTKKFAYDLWGDTINVASRMESTSLPGRVQISRSTYERVHDLDLQFEERKIEVKGKGAMQSYLLSDKAHERAVLTSQEIDELKEERMVEAETMFSSMKKEPIRESVDYSDAVIHDHAAVTEEEDDQVVMEPSNADLSHYTMKSK